MATRITRVSAQVLGQPTSQKARVTQVSAQVLGQPTSQKVRVTQVSAQVLVAAPPVPKARVSQSAVESLIAEIPAARVTQVFIEAVLLQQPPCQARVTQSVVETVEQEVPAARVTQTAVEAVCWRREPASLDVIIMRIDLDSGSRYYSDGVVRHPDWAAAGMVMSWGAINRESPVPFGLPRWSEFSASLANATGEFSAILSTELLNQKRVRVWVGPEGGQFGRDFRRVFDGHISRVSLRGPRVEISATPRLMRALSDNVANTITAADWPDLPAGFTEGAKPIIYGGAARLACPYVDDVGFRYLIAAHPVADVTAVYVDGVLTPTGWSVVESTVAGTVHSLLAFTGDQGDAVITCDVAGVPVPGTATAMTNPVDILCHYFSTYMGSAGAVPMDVGTARRESEGRSWVFATTITGGQTHETFVGRVCQEFGLELIQTWTGSLELRTWSVESAMIRADGTPELNDSVYTLLDTYDYAAVEAPVTRVEYRYGWDETAGTWLGSGQIIDTQAEATTQQRTEKIDLRFVQSADSARSVARRRQFWQSHRAHKVSIAAPAWAVLGLVDVGDLVSITGTWQPTLEGRASQFARVVGMQCDLSARRLQLDLVGTGIFSRQHLLSDRASPPGVFASAMDDERWAHWYLADRSTGEFSDGEPAQRFAGGRP